MRHLAAELSDARESEVLVEGWVHRVRELSAVAFVIVRDRSGLVQVVCRPPDQTAELCEETVVRVHGYLVENPKALGGHEIIGPSIEIVSVPVAAPQIDHYRPTIKARLPTLLDHAPVTLRHPRFRAIHAISSASAAGFRAALRAWDFTEVFTLKIVGTATESGANVFPVQYFDQTAYLAQSPQFYKQIMVGVYERVFEVGPVFRAEAHDTARHLAEYVSLDAELGFVRDHTDVMAVVRHALAGMVEAVRAEARSSLTELGLELPDVPNEIPAVHFKAAQARLESHLGEDLSGEPDLAPAHERLLCEWTLEEHGSDFLFVTGYPMKKRPFYTHPDAQDPTYSNGFDLLFRGQELSTGGQRLHRYQDYVDALVARGEGVEPYQGYLETFEYGMPPHGGFAIGLERWTNRIVGLTNIRESTLFPRDMLRLTP